MDQMTIPKEKKSFLRNDPLLVCGMLVVYGVCILGLIGATIWGLDKRSKRLSAEATSTAFALATQQANATSTAFAVATKQANVTATAVAHQKQLEEYEFIERFDENTHYWAEGSTDDEYSVEKKDVVGGMYIWVIYEVKQPFVSWEDFYVSVYSSNYDAYVDTRIVEGALGTVCSGLLFGMSSLGFDEGAFVFVVCNDSTYYLSHYDEKDDWQDIVDRSYHPSIQVGNWNRLEVSSRGAGFAILINGEVVYEAIDDHYAKGDLALIIDVSEAPAKIQFDNFGYQPR